MGLIKQEPNNQISAIACRIVEGAPDPVVRWRLERDVFGLNRAEPGAQTLYENLWQNRHVRKIEQDQRADGGWGRFHSKDSKRKRNVPTTEFAVERALVLGLEPGGPILDRAAGYISSLLAGQRRFPDPPEKNDRWAAGARLFLAATLARLQPEHPLVESERALWLEIFQRVFRSGAYDPQAEIRAHRELTRASVRDSYLIFGTRYHLDLLGSKPEMLSSFERTAWLRWLWNREEGIGYLGIPMQKPPPERPGPFERWLASLEVLARCLPEWTRVAGAAIDWIWAQRKKDGFWDFGSRAGGSSFLPLSDSWRRRPNRINDWTTRILALLNKIEKPFLD